MTGHQINSLVGDLVAMAQAMERLPTVERERDGYRDQNESLHDTIQRLELKLMDAKNLEETLRSAIRDLEVARDDAELRFLEADDGKLAAVRAMRHIIDEAEGLINIVEPPKFITPPSSTTTISDWHNLQPDTEGHPVPLVSEVKPIAADPTHTEPVGHMEGSSTGQSEMVGNTDPQAWNTTTEDHCDPLPIPAQPSPTGTGTESVTSDTEPTKYLVGEGGWSYINPEWASWRDRQPPNSSTW